MKIGVPKEIKDQEFRIALIPNSVQTCVADGNKVFIQEGAGLGIGVSDKEYSDVGAIILKDAKSIYAESELIVKVKEPQENERKNLLKPNQALFAYLHLAPDAIATKDLLDKKIIGIAFETVGNQEGVGTPLLAPMSHIAGRLSTIVAARLLEKYPDGIGKLIGGIAGVDSAEVVVIGGGVAGENAIDVAIGMGAKVTVFDTSSQQLQKLSERFGPALTTKFSNKFDIQKALSSADIAIGAVHRRGALAGHVVSKIMVSKMPKKSIIIDICIDQGGCFETSKPTTHSHPTYIEDGVIHYCVANMPGVVPLTASHALSHAITPYLLLLAKNGVENALKSHNGLLKGLNVYKGNLTNKGVADAQSLKYDDPLTLF